MDIFSLGCVMHYCLTGGSHPFGGNYERDTNIMRGAPNLSALAGAPEASNLVAAMLSKAPAGRPAMAGVLAHPFWWGVEQRLQFLVDVSDRCAGRGGPAARGRVLKGRLQQPPAASHGGSQPTAAGGTAAALLLLVAPSLLEDRDLPLTHCLPLALLIPLPPGLSLRTASRTRACSRRSSRSAPPRPARPTGAPPLTRS